MPISSDPAPRDADEQFYECLACGARVCSEERVTACPECEGRVQNISRPRPE